MNINIHQIFVYKRLFTHYLKLTYVVINRCDLKPQSYMHTHTAIVLLLFHASFITFIILSSFSLFATRKTEIKLALPWKILRADSSVRSSSLLSIWELQIAESQRSTVLNFVLNRTPSHRSDTVCFAYYYYFLCCLIKLSSSQPLGFTSFCPPPHPAGEAERVSSCVVPVAGCQVKPRQNIFAPSSLLSSSLTACSASCSSPPQTIVQTWVLPSTSLPPHIKFLYRAVRTRREASLRTEEAAVGLHQRGGSDLLFHGTPAGNHIPSTHWKRVS